MAKQKFAKALYHAFAGMRYFFLHERNGQIELGMALLVIAAAVGFGVSAIEWAILMVCIGIVLSAEMVNSCIEQLCNLVQKEYHPSIKLIKDMAAAAVLVCSLVSLLVAACVFLPKIF